MKEPNFNLTRSMNVAVRWLAGVYVISCLTAIGVAVYSSRIHHERLAEAMALSVRNSLVIRDLRQAISTLHPAIDSSFSSISFLTENGELIISLPSSTRVEESNRALFERKIEIPIVASSSEFDRKKTIGILNFTYSIADPLGVAFGFWLFFLIPIVAVFRWVRAFVERRHLEILQAREAEVISAVVQQVSHDIRSPLSALNIAIGRIEGLPEDQQRLIKSASERISGIANDLLRRDRLKLAHSPPQSVGGLTLERATRRRIVVAEVLRSVFEEKEAGLLKSMKAKLILDLPEASDAVCEIDEVGFSRALSNIMNNALEALDGEEGSVTLALRSSRNSVVVVISDNGKGIEQSLLSRIGKERISFGKKGTESGSGLGVYHARMVVESMGGRMSMQSRIGVGTMVTMTLPRCDV